AIKSAEARLSRVRALTSPRLPIGVATTSSRPREPTLARTARASSPSAASAVASAARASAVSAPRAAPAPLPAPLPALALCFRDAPRGVDLLLMVLLACEYAPKFRTAPDVRAGVPIIGGSCGHPARPDEAHQPRHSAMIRACTPLVRGCAALCARICATSTVCERATPHLGSCKVLSMLSVLAAGLLILSSCATQPTETPSGTAQAPAPPRVGAPSAQRNRTGTPLGPAQNRAPGAVPHVAVLLPLSGRQAGAAATIRDGFLTAYYVSPSAGRPLVRLYDTGSQSVAQAVDSAVRAGAVFIVGPLTREEVAAAAQLPVPRPPILALNFLPAGAESPGSFYQFALSPEDEARDVAQRILADGHHRGVAVAPDGEWGSRVLAAFRE